MCHAAWQEAFELSCPHGMLKLANGLGFNLPHALAGDFEDAADFLERIGVAVADAVTELDDFSLAIRQRLEDLLDLVLEHLLRRAFDRVVGLFVFDEITE